MMFSWALSFHSWSTNIPSLYHDLYISLLFSFQPQSPRRNHTHSWLAAASLSQYLQLCVRRGEKQASSHAKPTARPFLYHVKCFKHYIVLLMCLAVDASPRGEFALVDLHWRSRASPLRVFPDTEFINMKDFYRMPLKDLTSPSPQIDWF